MKTTRGTWYEVWDKNGYGTRLDGNYDSQREAKKAAKEATERQIEKGYNPQEWIIMIADLICTMEDDGTIISKTLTYSRI